MQILAILFFAAAAFFAIRVIGDVLNEDAARMWAALMGRSYHPAVIVRNARVVVLRQPEQRTPVAFSPEVAALPLAA